jgi:uncharacterized membrane protein YedE/YeeE
MNDITAKARPDFAFVAITLVLVGLLAAVLLTSFSLKQALLFLTGAGLGVSLLHAAFGFSSAWRNFIVSRDSRGVRAQLWLFICCVLLFFPILGNVFPSLAPGSALGPVGISVLVGAFLFGIGMEIGNGCGSGTLFTVGGGHVNMLITLIFFIVGSVIGTIHLHWWTSLPSLGKVSMIKELGWLSAVILQVSLLAGLYLLVRYLDRRRNGQLRPVTVTGSEERPFLQRLVYGPWPLSWGVVGLALFSLLTLVLAGHPWSITFAYGLWGAKALTALGIDMTTVGYWSSGYPARALNQSVLADVTSIMDFGIVLGAMLAASLAGKFAPAKKIPWRLVLASMLGGLLLGYGARLAFGCNIGGMFAGLSSGSVHGWLWLAAGFTGSVAGVYFRRLLGLDRDRSH